MPKSILFSECSTKGIDFEISVPLIYFCEKYLNCQVDYLSVFDLRKILTTQPDIVIMSNTTGAKINHKLTKLVYHSGFPLFSHVSEGMYREDVFDDIFWGWNKDKTLYEINSMQWSERCTKLVANNLGDLALRTPFSGSIGHDKYKIFLAQKLPTGGYKKIVGYAGFDFHNLKDNESRYIEVHGEELIRTHQRNALKLNLIFHKLCRHNPDILFILKAHPGDSHREAMEMADLKQYPNVRIYSNEHSIFDVIAACDIWLNYTSSTNLEAWLLGKPSIVLCADEIILKYVQVSEGAIITDEVDQIQAYINEFYRTGKINDFEIKQDIRQQLISDLIGFDDGLNHLRFMSFLKPYFESRAITHGRWDVPQLEQLLAYVRHTLFTLSKGRYNTPLLKKRARQYDIFNSKEVEEAKKVRYPDFDAFYAKHSKQIEDIYTNYALQTKQYIAERLLHKQI